jgi:hypothetical protein
MCERAGGPSGRVQHMHYSPMQTTVTCKVCHSSGGCVNGKSVWMIFRNLELPSRAIWEEFSNLPAICLQSACKLTFPACNLAIWLQSGCLTATSVQWPVPSKTAVHFTSALSIMRYGGNHQSPVRPDTNSLAITQGHDCQLSFFLYIGVAAGQRTAFQSPAGNIAGQSSPPLFHAVGLAAGISVTCA